MKWFRWHRGTCSNPKFALIAARANKPAMCGSSEERVDGAVNLTDVIAVWAVILEDAACKEHWGVLIRDANFISIVLRWHKEEVQSVLDAFVEEGMLSPTGGGYGVIKWEEYQYVSDFDPTRNERQKRYYDRHKRNPNGPLTRTDTDTDTDTEKKVSKRERASPSAQPEVFHVEQTVKGKGKSMKGARLSEGWLPSSEDHLYAVGLLGEEGVARQLDDFRDYWMAKSGAGALKIDWARTWRTWCRKAKDWKGNGNGSGGPRPLQDNNLSASRAAGRLAEAARRGEFVFGPRPSLYPAKSPDDLLLLPKGRDPRP